jgi:hypothetical protein
MRRRRHNGTAGPHCLCLITPPIYADLTPQSDLVGPRPGDGVQTVAGLGYGGSYREACPTMVPLWRNARSAAQWDWDVGGGMGMDPAAQTPNPVRRWDSALLVRIGARGFEPRTSCSRSRRANRAALRPVCRRGRNVMCPPAFGRPRRGCPGPLSPQPMDVTRQQPLLIRLDPTLRARFGRDRRMPFTPRGSSRSPAGGGSTRRSRPQPRATGRTQAPSPAWVCRASWRGY